MVKRTRRKRSVKESQKAADSIHDSYDSPIRPDLEVWDSRTEPIPTKKEETEPTYNSRFVLTLNNKPLHEPVRSPLPHEVYKNSNKEEKAALNIYNCSPLAVEKRQKMISKRQEMLELEKSNILPKLLEINRQPDFGSNIPLLLQKSLSEGCDPFESVKRNLSNGTLQRDKIFSKIKVSEDVRIGGKSGSLFNPFVRSNNPSHRTASSSYDSNINDDEYEKKSVAETTAPLRPTNFQNSQNSNRDQAKNKGDFGMLDSNMMDHLDNYSSEVLQKTALILLEKSLAKTKSLEIPTVVDFPLEPSKILNFSEKSSVKNDVTTEEDNDHKPCNCRKSKCLKLYCECFSNGRKCTSKCDCSPCCNTPFHEDLIAKSREQIITRNPDAFKPKFCDEEESKKNKSKKHQRGCNCQKSGCLKKYCECYQMNVPCSDLCRCVGCHNWKPSGDGDNKDTNLGKRKRAPQPLRESNSSDVRKEIVIPYSQSEGTYTLKPRKAKENRFLKFNDFSIELLGKQV